MANRVTLLEERLQRVDERSRRIMESATEIVPDTNPQEIWWPYVVSFYQDEHVPFEKVRIDRRCSMIVLQLFAMSRGKRGEDKAR